MQIHALSRHPMFDVVSRSAPAAPPVTPQARSVTNPVSVLPDRPPDHTGAPTDPTTTVPPQGGIPTNPPAVEPNPLHERAEERIAELRDFVNGRMDRVLASGRLGDEAAAADELRSGFHATLDILLESYLSGDGSNRAELVTAVQAAQESLVKSVKSLMSEPVEGEPTDPERTADGVAPAIEAPLPVSSRDGDRVLAVYRHAAAQGAVIPPRVDSFA